MASTGTYTNFSFEEEEVGAEELFVNLEKILPRQEVGCSSSVN
jgi:hypothetical protein